MKNYWSIGLSICQLYNLIKMFLPKLNYVSLLLSQEVCQNDLIYSLQIYFKLCSWIKFVFNHLNCWDWSTVEQNIRNNFAKSFSELSNESLVSSVLKCFKLWRSRKILLLPPLRGSLRSIFCKIAWSVGSSSPNFGCNLPLISCSLKKFASEQETLCEKCLSHHDKTKIRFKMETFSAFHISCIHCGPSGEKQIFKVQSNYSKQKLDRMVFTMRFFIIDYFKNLKHSIMFKNIRTGTI